MPLFTKETKDGIIGSVVGFTLLGPPFLALMWAAVILHVVGKELKIWEEEARLEALKPKPWVEKVVIKPKKKEIG